jgi:dTDP-4-dehydrorhamnose reductase
MRIFITGGSGVIGSRLAERLCASGDEVHYTFLKNDIKISGARTYNLDITDKASLKKAVEKANPEVVIHTVALSSVDLCETNRNLADEVNIAGTEAVTDLCVANGSRIVFISTAHVFDGKKSAYTEDDQANPINYYGKTKLDGERIISRSGAQYLILRTDQPYGWVHQGQKDNAIVRTLRALGKPEAMNEIVDWYNTPTYTWDFVDAATKLIYEDKTGTYNAVGPEYINRYEWGVRIANAFGKDSKLIKPIESEELKLPAKRPNARLLNSKIEKETGVRFKNITDGLAAMKDTMPDQ